ncbi:MAG: hypothetical protein ACOVNL_12460 [Prochlorococcaceae cyanobacterium]|jgi:hypothetical protein
MAPKYVALMASLPPIGPSFESGQTPISRLRLESRLRMLDERDAATLHAITGVITWADQPVDRTDPDFVAATGALLAELRQPVLRRIVSHRLDQRTVVVALRRRHRGETSPPTGTPWGWGQWVNTIERRWGDPLFGLGGVLPWLAQAKDLLEADDAVGLERLQFNLTWRMLDTLAAGHGFDFVAVVVYLMRWSMVARWSCYRADAAEARFAALVEKALQSFTPSPHADVVWS